MEKQRQHKEHDLKKELFPLLSAGQEPIIFLAYEKEKSEEKESDQKLLTLLDPQEKKAALLLMKRDLTGKPKPREKIADALSITSEELDLVEQKAVAKLTELDPEEEKAQQTNDTKHLSPLQKIFYEARRKKGAEENSALNELRKNSEFKNLAAPKDREKFETALQQSNSVRELIAGCNTRLVQFVANKHKQDGLTFEDREMEGNIGLLMAIDKFDYRKGFKFSTYATWWIKQAIGREVNATDNNIRLPEYVAEYVPLGRRKAAEFEAIHGRIPTKEELAKELIAPRINEGAAQTIADFSLDRNISTLSLNNHISDTELEIGDLLIDPEAKTEEQAIHSVDTQSLAQALSKALSSLGKKRDTEIFFKRNVENISAVELSQIYGLSSERIRQIERTVREKLQKNPELITIWEANK